jgi:hypothetical protein
MASTLVLGGIAFDDYSTPSAMGAGGKQAMVVHKLPGGSRVVDTLGPDEDNIAWTGQFFSNDALEKVAALDGMRAAGLVLGLEFAGQFRSVIIDSFKYQIRREPVWIEYQISCLVYQNPMLGVVSVVLSDLESLVQGDLAFAVGLL